MYFRTKKEKKLKIIKWLYLFGILLLVTSVLLVLQDYIVVGFIFLFISSLLMMPDYWVFFLKKNNADDRWSLYWFFKFLALLLALIVCIVFFIHKLLN
jgi:hypothetical protein